MHDVNEPYGTGEVVWRLALGDGADETSFAALRLGMGGDC
jgi:hypothetical protein